MTAFQAIAAALVQGLTEFLPVSGSSHMVLMGGLLDWPARAPGFEAAVHIGALLSVLVYFRNEIYALVLAWLSPATVDNSAGLRTLGIAVILGSVPIMAAGLLAYDAIAASLSDVRVIAGGTLIFGWMLLIADRAVRPVKSLDQLGLFNALLIGVVQVLALIPGASRTGVTIMIGRMLGFDSQSAARFSFLLSIPVIGAVGSHGLYQSLAADSGVDWQNFGMIVLCTAVAGWAAIKLFLALLQRIGLLPFIIYRLVLGIVLAVALA
jgi:undecaprenyl-diphosphatase